ncbi:MAG: insulinase family protein [Phycisphaerae bacterium]|nr:insulinase family protein [Phycisphaerae bacterium]
MSVEFRQATLDNGLQIIGEVNEEAHTAATGFFVRTGSRDEQRPLMGVSHFLEHMMFKGTERRSADQVNRDFDRIGASYNASTSQEVTTYYAHVLPEYLPDAIDLLSDILRPSLRDADFDMEKNVILEEIGMYADKPFWVVYEQAMEDYFGENPLGFRILGTNDSVTDLSREKMGDYFRQRYSPDNMVVSLAGRLDFDACVGQIEQACGAWERTGAERSHGQVDAKPSARDLDDDSANMHYLLGLCPGPSAQDDRRYAAAVLSHVLGDAEGSRMYWELIDPGLADEAELSHHGFDQTGVFVFYASCDPKRAGQVGSVMSRILDRAGEGLKADEVERAKRKIAMSLTLSGERPAGRMQALGGQWLYLGKHQPLAEELDRLEAVEVADLVDLVDNYGFEPRTLVRLTPGRKRKKG